MYMVVEIPGLVVWYFYFLYVDTRVNGLLLFSSGVTGLSFAILLR